MGVTEEETEDATSEDADALQRVLVLAGERVASHQTEQVRTFARAYLRRPGGGIAIDAAPEDLVAEVVGAFLLMAERGSAPAAVRAFTPARSDHGYESTGSVVETNTQD